MNAGFYYAMNADFSCVMNAGFLYREFAVYQPTFILSLWPSI